MDRPVILLNLRKVATLMTVIDFEAKIRERELNKRYEYIQSKVQLGQWELFDELIAEEEGRLTDEKTASCSDFIRSLDRMGHEPLVIFQEAIFMPEEVFYEEHEVNWHIAIEEALTYYAVLRKHDRNKYELDLLLHPYVGFAD